MRLLRLLAWAALLALIGISAASYGELPAEIPAHIGLGGEVTRTSDKSILGWFALPLIALAVHLLIEGVGVMLPSRPHWFNFPEKARFLALPKASQAPVIEEMRTLLDITLLGTNGLMLVIQYHLWRMALGEKSDGVLLAVAIVPVFLTPAILFWLTRVTAALEREEARLKSAGA